MLPEPYYQSTDGTITLYHGDCLDILPLLPSGSVDAVVTDPPYGMNYASGWQSRPIANDLDTTARDAMLELWGDRPAIVFGRWNLPHPSRAHTMLTWDKGDWPGMGDLSLPWGPSTENIYVIGKGFVGKRRGTVVRQHRLTGNMDHPNEKPIGLITSLLGNCPPGTILDPFLGSGTIAVACIKTGRKCIGIELSEQYCAIAARRCEEAFDSQALFRQPGDNLSTP